MKEYSQASYFQVFAIHDHIVEAEERREPIFDHWVVCMCSTNICSRSETAIRALQHNWNDTSEHRDCQETDLLVFVDFAKIGNADGQVGEGAMLHN